MAGIIVSRGRATDPGHAVFRPPGTARTRCFARWTPVSPPPSTSTVGVLRGGGWSSDQTENENEWEDLVDWETALHGTEVLAQRWPRMRQCGTWCRAPRAEGVTVRNRPDGAKPPVRERLRSVPSRDAVARWLVGTLLRVRTTVFRSCGTPPPHGSFGGDGRKTISRSCKTTTVPYCDSVNVN